MSLYGRIDQRGAASMLSVAIFAIIVTVVVTAYFRSAMNQQADSITHDFSTRAYYAAESGVQDALRAVNADPNLVTKDDCGNFVPSVSANNGILNEDLSLKYTCQLISKAPENITFGISEGENVTVRLSPQAPPSGDYEIVMRWSHDSNDSNLAPREADSAHFPSQNEWITSGGIPIHSALRVSMITYPSNNPSAIQQRVLFLNPIEEGLMAGQGETILNFAANEAQQQEQLVQPARCYNSGSGSSFDGYLCEQRVKIENTQLTNNTLFARFRSLYRATDVQLSMRETGASGVSIPIKDAAVEIDVTGNAGSTFRRVRQLFTLKDGIMRDNLPEAAVIGGDGICKHYSITDDPDDFNNLGNCFIP